MKRSYKMVTKWHVRVNGRVFQITDSEARKDELVNELLPQFYPGADITAEVKRERRYM